MKTKSTLLILVALLLIPLFGAAQDTQGIKGKYVGSIEENGKINTYYLKFDKSGYAYQCKSDWTTRTFLYKKTSSKGQITNLQWINKGGVWTETQLFSIVKVSNTLLRVVHMRHVVNKGSEGKSWFYGGVGNFVRISD